MTFVTMIRDRGMQDGFWIKATTTGLPRYQKDLIRLRRGRLVRSYKTRAARFGASGFSVSNCRSLQTPFVRPPWNGRTRSKMKNGNTRCFYEADFSHRIPLATVLPSKCGLRTVQWEV